MKKNNTKPTKANNKRKVIIIVLIVAIIALTIFACFFAKKLMHETNLKEQARLSAQRYMESTNMQFEDKVSIPLSLLKDGEYLAYFDDKCLDASYVIVSKNGDNYDYTPVIICDNSKAIIKLNGDSIQKVEIGEDYIEEGATLEGDAANDIKIGNNVDTNKKGTYSVTYTIPGSDIPPVLRVIEVVDTTKPILTLKNSDLIYLMVGDTYTESGYKAIDNYDGDITSKVTVSGTVDTNKAGTYYITYTVSDSSNNTTTVKRQVVVKDNTPQITLKGYATVYVDVFGTYTEEGYTAIDQKGNNLTKKVIVTGSVNTSVVGDYVITYKVTSENGMVVTARRVVKVVDRVKPNLTINGESTLTLKWGQDVYHELGAIATDNYDGDISNRIQITGIFNPNKIGTYYLTYTVTDRSGNKATAQRIIKVVDTEAPIITLNGDETVYLESGDLYHDLGVNVKDNYDKVVTVETKGFVNTTILGSYTLIYTATDSSNNTTSITRTVIVRDTTAPIITLKGDSTMYVELGSTYTDPGYTATDNYDKYVNKNVTVNGTVDATKEGTYVITYNVTDVNGNVAKEVTRTVIVRDTTAPTIETKTDDLFNENHYVKKATVFATINDLYNDIKSVRYAWTNGSDPTTWLDYTNYIENTEITFEQENNGTMYLFIEATDASNNEKQVKVGPFKIDSIKPSVNFVPNGATGSTISTELKVEDSFSGIDKIYYAWSDSNTTAPTNYEEYTNTDLTQSTDGTYYLWIKVVDKAGNEIETVSNAFIVDNAYPTINFQYPSNNPIVKEAIVDVTASGNSGKTITKVEYQWTKTSTKPETGYTEWTDYEDNHVITMPNDLDGEYYLWIKATDSLGLVSYSSSRMITLDNTNPTIDLDLNGNTTPSKNAIIKITVGEVNIDTILWEISEESDISKVTLSNKLTDLENTITIEDLDGVYYLHVIATDKAGNYTEFTSNAFTFDNTAPVDPEITFDSNWTNADLTVTITGTNNIEYSFDNEIWVTYENPFTVSENTKVYARATDEAGNVSNVISKDITNIDKTEPVVELTYDTDLSNILKVNYKITEAGSGIKEIYYAWTTDEVKPTFTETLTDVEGEITKNDQSGTYYLWIKVIDNAGNKTVINTSMLSLDKDAPIISIIEGNGTNGPVTKAESKVEITDDNELDIRYIYTTSADKPNDEDAWTSWYDYSEMNNTLTLDGKIIDGIYYLHITATDAAGNTTYVVSNPYVLVNSLPLVTYDPATNLDYQLVVSSTVTATLENATIKNLYYAWSTEGTSENIADWAEFTSGDTLTKDDATGEYYLYIKVVDDVDGNRETIIRSTGTFNLDKDNVNVSFDPNGTNGPVKEIETEIIANDTHSGINTIKYAWGTSNIISPDTSEFVDYELGTTISKTTENSYETFYLWVEAIDQAGNKNYTVSNAYEIDNSYPTIDLDPNRSNPVNDISINVTITIDNNKTLQHIYYAWSTSSTVTDDMIFEEWNLDDYAANPVLTKSGLEGTYYLHVKVVDSNNLVAIKSTYALKFDNTAPVTTITPSTGNPVQKIEPIISVVEENDYTIFYSFTTEANSLLANYTAWEDFMGQGNDQLTLGGVGFDGIYYLHIKTVDEAGNVSYATENYELDNTAPSKPSIDFDFTWTNDKAIMNITGESNLEYSFDNEIWVVYDENNKPGMTQNGTFYARSVDEAGNISEVAAATINNIDKTSPSVDIVFSTIDWTNKDVKLTLEITDDGLSSIKAIRWSPISLTIDDYRNGRGYAVNLDSKTFVQGINREYIQIYVEDEAGNVTLLTTSVSNIDKVAPEIIIKDSTITIDEKTEFDIFEGVSVKDNVGFGDNKLTATEFSTETPGTYTVTYTITDLAGNTTTATRTIIVLDKTAPEITLNGDDEITLEVKDTYTELGATATDNVDGDVTANIQISGTVDTNTVGTYTITYTVTDNAGNTSTVTRTIKVVDTTKPSLSLNGDSEITLEVKDTYTELGATATDNYDGDISSKVVITGTVDTNTVGTYTLNYTVTDANGNIADSVTRTVKVVDTIKPSLSLNGNSEITLEVKDAYTELGATATDNYDGDISSKVVITGTVDTNTVGTYTLTYTVTDANGNIAESVTRTINVVDTTKPSLSLNGNSELTLEVKDTYTELGATATDNYDGDISSKVVITGTVDTTTVGTYTLTYTVTDANGNVAESVIRTIHVVDTTKPSLSLNGDSEITLEVKDTYTELGATATDNYDGDISFKVVITGTVNTNVVGTYTITYTVTDSNNNTSVITRTIKVMDSEAPVINLKGESEVTLKLGKNYIESGYTITDNYDADLTATVSGTINTNKVGDYTLTYTTTDSNDNKTTVTRIIHVIADTLENIFREDNSCEVGTDCFSVNNATDNYVWYSGYLFRIYKTNNNGTVKLITQDSISTLSYDDDSSIFAGSVIENWLNDTFYNSLNQKDKFLANSNWCNLNTSDATNNRTTCTASAITSGKVGLLTLFEYNLVGGKNSYLNNENYFFTMTRYGAQSIWSIGADGSAQSAEMVYNVEAIRPVITLVEGIKAVQGSGTANDPYRLENDQAAKTNEALNNRYTGEYVEFNNQLWRIVTSDNNGTKLILDGYLKDENGNIIEASYGETNNYSTSNVLSIMNNSFAKTSLLNTVWYKGSYNYGQNPIGTSIKNNGDYSNQFFGLIRIGELMSGKSSTFNMEGNTYWTMTNTNDGKVWHISTTGRAAVDNLTAPRAIRPVIKLNSNMKVLGGVGTYQNPYRIG